MLNRLKLKEMNKILIKLIAIAIVQLHIQIGFAQRDLNKEILVFFNEGVKRETRHENGVETMHSSIKSEDLRSSLNRIGIDERDLEVANPTFREADTLTILQDGTRLTQLNMTKLFCIQVPEGKSREKLIDELNRLPEVLYAEANIKPMPLVAPNDVRFGQQWALQRIQAEDAWDIYTGSTNSIIAVIDGGSDANHEDLRNKISGGSVGWGWGGHGIRVAGIAAASTHNTLGIAGVDWNARIHPRRIDNATGAVDVYNAIVNAVNYSPNVYVINNSWGNEVPDLGTFNITERLAFAYAYKANRVSVVAMGNHQHTHPDVIDYPAGFDNVISVGATDNNDVVWYKSAQGNHIDVSAPGVNILTTTINNDYTNSESGTSLAAPHVSGIASLLKGYRSQLSNDDIRNIIRLSADRVTGMGGQAFHVAYGTGRVNARRALAMVRDNTLRQWTATGGTVHSSSSTFLSQFLSAHPNLASAFYTAKRHEVRKTITFPEQFAQIIGVWGRGVGTSGWNMPNPNFGEGFCEVVSSTSSSVTLRTYVYELWSTNGQYLGYWPATPANVTFAYTVLGILSPVITGSTPICSGSQYSFTASNWVSGYTWAKSSNLNWGTNNDITKFSIDVKANGSGVGWVRVMSGSTIKAEYPVWVGVPDPFLYLLIEGQDGLYPPGWYITNYITACPLQFIALYPKYNEPTGVLEFQGQSSNISGIKFTSPTSITFKTTAKVGAMVSFDIRYRNTCGWSSSWAKIDIENVNCSKSPVLEEYKWKVYPNPTDNMLHIEQDTEAFDQSTSDKNVKTPTTYDIRLYDGQGNLLRQQTTKGGTILFNVSNLPDGIYYLHIYDGVNSTPEIHQIMVEH